MTTIFKRNGIIRRIITTTARVLRRQRKSHDVKLELVYNQFLLMLFHCLQEEALI